MSKQGTFRKKPIVPVRLGKIAKIVKNFLKIKKISFFQKMKNFLKKPIFAKSKNFL